jgi:hypothetical protein
MSIPLKFKSIVICLCLPVFLAAPLFATQEEEKENTEISGMASLKKSLFVPGWGQLAEKHTIEGVVFLAAEIFCLYKVLDNNHRGNEYYSLYKEAASAEDAVGYRELTETYDSRRNLYILAALGVWTVNLIDIYVIVKKNEKKKNTISIKIEHGEYKRLAVSVSFGF